MNNKDKIKIFFLVNANNRIGGGHLVRCRIIADEFKKREIKSVFIFTDTDNSFQLDIKKNYSIINWNKPQSLQSENFKQLVFKSNTKNNLLIIDTDNEQYYSKKFQKGILKTGFKLMHITVHSHHTFYSHFVLNQNIIALEQQYKTKPYTKTLLGPKYFILNKNFRKLNFIKKNNNLPPYNLFIAFGGADYYNLTEKLLESLSLISKQFKKIIIVLGGLNKNIENIKSCISKYNNLDTELHINTHKIHKLMNESDIAITSSGLTFWELSILGIPSFMIASSEREKYITDYLHKKQYCIKLGYYNNIPKPSELAKLIELNLKNGINNSIKLNKLKNMINKDGVCCVVEEIINGLGK